MTSAGDDVDDRSRNVVSTRVRSTLIWPRMTDNFFNTRRLSHLSLTVSRVNVNEQTSGGGGRSVRTSNGAGASSTSGTNSLDRNRVQWHSTGKLQSAGGDGGEDGVDGRRAENWRAAIYRPDRVPKTAATLSGLATEQRRRNERERCTDGDAVCQVPSADDGASGTNGRRTTGRTAVVRSTAEWRRSAELASVPYLPVIATIRTAPGTVTILI